MQILTKDGYKNIEDVVIGEELIYYDLYTGQKSTNHLLNKKILHIDDYQFIDSFPIYKINGITFSGFDSIWTSENNIWKVIHIQDLATGSIICDDFDNDLIISTFEFIGTSSTFWQLSVDGDSSFIGDGITLHNASRYWVGGGSTNNWTATGNTNWAATSGGANNQSVPVAADDVFFDSNSNTSCSVTSTVNLTNINFTGHTNTISISSAGTITVAGSVSFSGNSTITGDGEFRMTSAATTITTNSQTLNCNFYNIGNSGARTFVGTFSVNKNFTNNNTNAVNVTQLNRTNLGDNLYLNGGFRNILGNVGGTMPIWLQGGTVSCDVVGAEMQNDNIYINGSPSFGTFSVITGTVSYISGTPITTGSLLTNNGALVNLNTNGMIWDRVLLNGNTTVRFVSNFDANSVTINPPSNFTLGIATNATSLRTGSLNLIAGNILGSASIQFVRTGTWSSTGSLFQIPISFEPGCNIALTSGNTFTFFGTSMSYNGGTIATTGSIFRVASSCTLDYKGGFGFDHFQIYNNATVTNLSEILITGTFTVPQGNNVLNGSTINPRNISITGGNLTGTTTFTIKQTGNLNWTATNNLSNNFTFDSPGTSNITGSLRILAGTFSYIRGRFTGGSRFLYVGTSQILTNFGATLSTSMFAGFN
jgi:hypothetical protein